MIDLHIHSNYSDGSSSVKEILELAQDKNLELISITDHNTIDAYKEIRKNWKLRQIYHGKLITGIEISCLYKGNLVEVLGYGFDPRKLEMTLVKEKEIELKALKYMVMKAQEMGIYFDKMLFDRFNFSDYPAYYFFVDELLRKTCDEYLLGKDEPHTYFYYNHFNNPVSPYYFNYYSCFKSIKEVITDIHYAGGLVSLAHPFEYLARNEKIFIEGLILNNNLDLVECEYPTFSSEERKWLRDLCRRYGKNISGGSDYHGENRPNNELGTGIDLNLSIPYRDVRDWSKTLKNVLRYTKR